MHRKPLAALAAGLSVLAVAGIAFAHGGSPNSIQSASATFDAATVSDLKSDSCTGADGNYVRTRAKYTGTATSTVAKVHDSGSDPVANRPLGGASDGKAPLCRGILTWVFIARLTTTAEGRSSGA